MGTSEPSPLTCRSIDPRFTVSGQIVPYSTLGAAGFSRDTPSVIPSTARTAITDKITCLRRFFRFTDSSRTISISDYLSTINAKWSWSQLPEFKHLNQALLSELRPRLVRS
jgi:hypothetical protein